MSWVRRLPGFLRVGVCIGLFAPWTALAVEDASGTAFVRELAERSRTRPRAFAAPTGWSGAIAGEILFLQDDGSNGCSALVGGDTTPFESCFLGASGALEAYYSVFPEARPDFVVFTTAWITDFPAFFYMPVANDVRGIGYGHIAGAETFEDPASRGLSGFVFMNTPSALGFPGDPEWDREFDGVWAQEIAHRFGAFVHYADPATGEERDDILDDYGFHWRYPLDSGSSVMGGSDWERNDDGSFTTAPDSWHAWTYSPLDLYLMGLAPASAVGELTLIREPEPDYGQWGPLPSTPDAVTISGDAVRLTAGDVIAIEGERSPGWAAAPRSFHAPHVVVLRAEDDLMSVAADAAFEYERARASETFSRLTHGLGVMHTRLDPPATNQPPIARIAEVDGAVEGRRVTVDASLSEDPESGALAFAWDFGDGTGAWSSEPRIEHRFRSAGAVAVTVVAVDASGASDEAVLAVRVAAAADSGCACSLRSPRRARADGTIAVSLLLLAVGVSRRRRPE